MYNSNCRLPPTRLSRPTPQSRIRPQASRPRTSRSSRNSLSTRTPPPFSQQTMAPWDSAIKRWPRTRTQHGKLMKTRELTTSTSGIQHPAFPQPCRRPVMRNGSTTTSCGGGSQPAAPPTAPPQKRTSRSETKLTPIARPRTRLPGLATLTCFVKRTPLVSHP